MRLVLDTNCLVSAFLWGGTPRQLIGAAIEGQYQIFTSATLLAELEDVLAREKFRQRILSVQTSVSALLDELMGQVTVVHTANLPDPVCPDPDDDAVLACAVAAKADLIVSGDNDLLNLGEHQGIAIVSPAEALKRVSLPG